MINFYKPPREINCRMPICTLMQGIDADGNAWFGRYLDGFTLSALLFQNAAKAGFFRPFSYRWKNNDEDISSNSYIITPTELDISTLYKILINDDYSDIDDENYSNIHQVIYSSVSSPIGDKYKDYDMKGKLQYIYDGDLISPRGLDGDLIFIVREDYNQSGNPYGALKYPSLKYVDWPKWVDLDDFKWDIIGNIWQNKDLIVGWNWHKDWLDSYFL